MMLSLDTAYRSFGGEVEASSPPTICRLSDSRRHQLWAIAHPEPSSVLAVEPACCSPNSVESTVGRAFSPNRANFTHRGCLTSLALPLTPQPAFNGSCPQNVATEFTSPKMSTNL